MKAQAPRPLPANQHSERVILGELLLNNPAWKQAEVLMDDDFSLHSHRRIFACIRSRLSVERPIDLILLTDAMRRAKELDTVGGAGYLASLTEDNMRNLAIAEHVALLREKAALRRIMGACHDAALRAQDEEPSGEILKDLMEQLIAGQEAR